MLQSEEIVSKSSPLILRLEKTKKPIVFEELIMDIESSGGGSDELQKVKEEMQKMEAAVAVPLFAENRLIGFFNLGEKENGDIYDDEDIDFLNTISNQLAIAIERARLYQETLTAQKQLLQADKLASLGTVAAGMAHEIKNPLAAIKGMADGMERAFLSQDKETLADFKKVVSEEVDRINGLVQNLLSYSKPPRPQKSPVDLNNILENILKLLDSELAQKNIQIKKELSPLPQKELDPEQMRQVFTNLIINAMQSIHSAGGEITVKSYADGDKIVVQVADNGAGIPEDKLKNIFDPFFTTKEKGAGLGLAITHKIIEEHRGEITVQSKEKQGTAFTVSL